MTRRLDQTHDATKIIVIFLRHADGPGLTDEPPRPLRPAGPPLPEDDAVLYPQKSVLNETGGILGTVLATRSARGSYALDAIFNRYLARENIKVLSFTFRGERIPLSWSLSQRSCNEMLSQFPTSLKTPEARDADEATRRIIGSNNAVAEWLLNELYGP